VAEQIRSRLYSTLFFLLSVLLLFYVKLNKCESFIESLLGFLPLQVGAPATVVAGTPVHCLVSRPCHPSTNIAVKTLQSR
jgi:hypothetical protein